MELNNISVLCRCCHAEGEFKNLRVSYIYKKNVEIYSNMLEETFGITISLPSVDASNSICDECIMELRAATRFKKQVLDCEQTFLEYFKSEPVPGQITDEPSTEHIKIESDCDGDNDDRETNFNYENMETEDTNVVDSKDTDNDDRETNFSYENMETEDTNVVDSKDTEIECKTYTEDSKTPPKKEKKAKAAQKQKNSRSTVKGPKVQSKRLAEKNPKSAVKRPKVQPKKGKITRPARKIKQEENVAAKEEMDKTPFICVDCGYTSDTRGRLVKHVIEAHKRSSYTCQHCSENIIGLVQYYTHLAQHDIDQKNSKYQQVLSLINERKFVCDICQNRFIYKNTMKKHILLQHMPVVQHVCEECGLVCKEKTALKIHQRIVHQKLKPFACDRCSEKFSTKKSLKFHIMRHDGLQPFECKLCPSRYYAYYMLKCHIEKKHQVKTSYTCKNQVTKTYKCKICFGVLTNKIAYLKHMKGHRGVLPHQCDKCGKDFYNSYSFKRHLDSHSRDRKLFPCTQCDSKFTAKGGLNRHVRNRHDKPRTLKDKTKCHVCKVSFVNIEKHMLSHTNRPFSCTYCVKTFPTQKSCKRHLREHFSENYPCDLCNNVYRRKPGLKRHMLKAHNIIRAVKNESDSTLIKEYDDLSHLA